MTRKHQFQAKLEERGAKLVFFHYLNRRGVQISANTGKRDQTTVCCSLRSDMIRKHRFQAKLEEWGAKLFFSGSE